MKLQLKTTNSNLYSDLSYKEFFGTYNPYTDGQAYIATYSFSHKQFDFWSKLEPLSVIYVDIKYKRAALEFLRRFPMFEVYAVPSLHTKAIFFSDSCRLLVGSENFYSPISTFSEIMLETTISQEQREDVINTVFRSLEGEILTCQYNLGDIKITSEGYAYLPCEKEVSYWDLLSSRIAFGGNYPRNEYHVPSYIYHLLEYEVDGIPYVLSFNRGYIYSGDISYDAYQWLIENCEITQHHEQQSLSPSSASDLIDSSPRKDYFFKYHPIASTHKAIRGYWLSKVIDLSEHQCMVEPINLIDITQRKIRRPK